MRKTRVAILDKDKARGAGRDGRLRREVHLFEARLSSFQRGGWRSRCRARGFSLLSLLKKNSTGVERSRSRHRFVHTLHKTFSLLKIHDHRSFLQNDVSRIANCPSAHAIPLLPTRLSCDSAPDSTTQRDFVSQKNDAVISWGKCERKRREKIN